MDNRCSGLYLFKPILLEIFKTENVQNINFESRITAKEGCKKKLKTVSAHESERNAALLFIGWELIWEMQPEGGENRESV